MQIDQQTMDRLPWEIHEQHQGSYHLMMLGLMVRLQDGRGLRPIDRHRLAPWRSTLRDLNAVVVYASDDPEGFRMVPRLEGDGDLTRPPMRGEGEIR